MESNLHHQPKYIGVYNANMKKVLQEHDVKKRQQLARQLALPVRIQLVQEWSVMMTFLQQTIYSTGELGTFSFHKLEIVSNLN
jgi:hypothetical protein